MKLFLAAAVDFESQHEKRSITAIRAAVWAEADDLKRMLKD
jgi:hypothetical protein